MGARDRLAPSPDDTLHVRIGKYAAKVAIELTVFAGLALVAGFVASIPLSHVSLPYDLPLWLVAAGVMLRWQVQKGWCFLTDERTF
jgi:hypothetical protein